MKLFLLCVFKTMNMSKTKYHRIFMRIFIIINVLIAAILNLKIISPVFERNMYGSQKETNKKNTINQRKTCIFVHIFSYRERGVFFTVFLLYYSVCRRLQRFFSCICRCFYSVFNFSAQPPQSPQSSEKNKLYHGGFYLLWFWTMNSIFFESNNKRKMGRTES